MKSVVLFFTLLAGIQYVLSDSEKHLSGDELVDYINKNQNLWKAQRNEFLESMPKDMKKKFYGAKQVDKSLRLKYLKTGDTMNIDIPESFDARKEWPDCQSIKEIRDQSSCGSCWAFGAAEAISDRICVASKGSLQVHISVNDVLSCCVECGEGCNGGESLLAWKFWNEKGLVSGSDYVSNIGCRPYPFPPCSHHTVGQNPPCPSPLYPTPKCLNECSEYYPLSYKDDKHFGKSFYSLNDVENIQQDIMKYGPVEADFDVYEDFETYKGGIYKHIEGELIGGHAVKIIGWGIENGTKYWTIANSWNSDWGENGYFRFLRGENHCGIESAVSAGQPIIKN